jgi:hypothetical protein
MHLAFLIPSFDFSSPITMADTGVTNLDDATVFEKRGRGRPRGSKNKPKTSADASSVSTPAKRHHDLPLGSKNKKLSAATAGIADLPDVSLAQPVLPQESTKNLFSFFAFAGAQCREQQRLPLNFFEFMDGRELREAILRPNYRTS